MVQVRSEEVMGAARAATHAVRSILDAAGVSGELRLIWGSSLPGLVTRGDIDLLLRVPAVEFPATVDVLTGIFEPRRHELWTDEMALFLTDPSATVELAVVPAGSPQDDHFVVGWDRLAGDAALRAEYNRLKVLPGGDYDARKAEFFARIATAPSDATTHEF